MRRRSQSLLHSLGNEETHTHPLPVVRCVVFEVGLPLGSPGGSCRSVAKSSAVFMYVFGPREAHSGGPYLIGAALRISDQRPFNVAPGCWAPADSAAYGYGISPLEENEGKWEMC